MTSFEASQVVPAAVRNKQKTHAVMGWKIFNVCPAHANTECHAVKLRAQSRPRSLQKKMT